MLAIQYADPNHPQILALLQESQKLIRSFYETDEDHSLSIDELCEKGVRFLGAKIEETYIGCAALTLHENYGEIKSMFAASDHRGKGVGRALLGALEVEAINLNLPFLKLETGALLKEAIGLYAKFGFQFCGPFGEYTDDGTSLFMHKKIN